MSLGSADTQFTLDEDLLRAWAIIHAIRRDLRTQSRRPGCLQLYQDLMGTGRNCAERARCEF